MEYLLYPTYNNNKNVIVVVDHLHCVDCMPLTATCPSACWQLIHVVIGTCCGLLMALVLLVVGLLHEVFTLPGLFCMESMEQMLAETPANFLFHGHHGFHGIPYGMQGYPPWIPQPYLITKNSSNIQGIT